MKSFKFLGLTYVLAAQFAPDASINLYAGKGEVIKADLNAIIDAYNDEANADHESAVSFITEKIQGNDRGQGKGHYFVEATEELSELAVLQKKIAEYEKAEPKGAKELKAEIEALKTENTALKAELLELKNTLTKEV